MRHLIGGDPPNNEGYFRPIEVVAPPGTIVNPVLPASVAARGLTGFRIANAVFGALAQVAPDRVFACEVGRRHRHQLSAATTPSGGRSCSSSSCSAPGAAGPTRDGVDACSSSVVNFSNNPIEVIEAEYPIRIQRYGYVPDTGGAGQFRGGLALDPRVPLRGDRGRPSSSAPTAAGSPARTGWPGGRAGTPSRERPESRHGRPRRSCRRSARLTLQRGDVFRHVSPAPAAGAIR